LSDFKEEFPSPFNESQGEYLFISSDFLPTSMVLNSGIEELASFISRGNRKKYLQELLNGFPSLESCPLEFYRGNLAAEKGLFEVAIKHYKKALHQSPKNIDVLRRLGKVYRQMGHFEQAASTYQELCQQDPVSLKYQLLHAECLLECGNCAEALVLLYQLDCDYPDNIDIRKSIAWTQLISGNIDAAKREFDAIKRSSENVNIGIAYILWIEHKVSEVVLSFKQYVAKLTIKNESQRNALKRLFENDHLVLENNGITENEQIIMIDLVCE